MSIQVICKNCGAIMFEAGENLLCCPNCDNEAYPDVEDPEHPGEIMQLMPEEDYDDIFENYDRPAAPYEAPWTYADDYEDL